MAIETKGTVLIDGTASGTVLKLAEPISFWGGVEAATGKIIQPAHPDFGACLTGKVLVLPGTIGSSSSSAIMLELIRQGTAPAAVVMAETDAILALGAVVAEELGLVPPPMLCAPVETFETGMQAEISGDALIRLGVGS